MNLLFNTVMYLLSCTGNRPGLTSSYMSFKSLGRVSKKKFGEQIFLHNCDKLIPNTLFASVTLPLFAYSFYILMEKLAE